MLINLRQKMRKTTETIPLFPNTKPAARASRWVDAHSLQKPGIHGGSAELQKLTGEKRRPATNSADAWAT